MVITSHQTTMTSCFKCSADNCTTPAIDRCDGSVVIRVGFIYVWGYYNDSAVWVRISKQGSTPFYLHQDKHKFIVWGDKQVQHIASDIYCKNCVCINNNCSVGSWNNPRTVGSKKLLTYAAVEMISVLQSLGISTSPLQETNNDTGTSGGLALHEDNERPILSGLSGGSQHKLKPYVEDALRHIIMEELSFLTCHNCNHPVCSD